LIPVSGFKVIFIKSKTLFFLATFRLKASS
jgi:hypothetical protein